MKKKFDWQLWLMFGLFALDFSIVVASVYLATVPAKLSPVAAILVGIGLAVVALGLCFIEGRTVMELTVSAFILLVLLIVLMPVFFRARSNTAKKQTQQRVPQPASVKP